MKSQMHIPEKEATAKSWPEKVFERMRHYARCCRHTYRTILNT